jgi:hypothetical protein
MHTFSLVVVALPAPALTGSSYSCSVCFFSHPPALYYKSAYTQRRHGKLKDWTQALPQPQRYKQRHRPTTHSFLY